MQSKQLQIDDEALGRAQLQINLITYAIEFHKDKNNNSNANDRTHTPLVCIRNTMNGIETCSTPHSSSLSHIFGHTNTCKISDCLVCPKIGAENNCCQHCNKQQQQNVEECSINGDAMSPRDASEQASNLFSSTDWHHSITQAFRNHLIEKQVEAIHSAVYQDTIHDERTDALFLCTKKSEENAYQMANSRIEYYFLMANEMFDIRNDLKERRQKRKYAQMMQNQCVSASSSSSSSTVSDLHQTSQSQSQSHVHVIDLTNEPNFSDIQEEVSDIIPSFS